MNRVKAAALARLYASMPTVACKGLCAHECRTHIGAHPIEQQAMEEASGKPLVFHRLERRCGHLTPEHRCAVYEHRPLMCRAYGVVQAMRCPHGCVPDRWMSDDEARALFTELENLSGGKVGRAAKVVP